MRIQSSHCKENRAPEWLLVLVTSNYIDAKRSSRFHALPRNRKCLLVDGVPQSTFRMWFPPGPPLIPLCRKPVTGHAGLRETLRSRSRPPCSFPDCPFETLFSLHLSTVETEGKSVSTVGRDHCANSVLTRRLRTSQAPEATLEAAHLPSYGPPRDGLCGRAGGFETSKSLKRGAHTSLPGARSSIDLVEFPAQCAVLMYSPYIPNDCPSASLRNTGQSRKDLHIALIIRRLNDELDCCRAHRALLLHAIAKIGSALESDEKEEHRVVRIIKIPLHAAVTGVYRPRRMLKADELERM
ncbi:hypothetical protein LshimejAT787_1602000 [Lyophyllum shimeji]|uniref:Uncharacterized protein n=1 Tax=Lyophyllum shimeji TaxID=47721 RepID=A0A9P3PYB9_LYOSH|nr:hypothetical protein LshimejAT787_1602000 [Lyophyllum shimeji]